MKTNTAYAMEALNLKKVYHRGSEEIPAVHDVSMRIEQGAFVACIGPSGSGKTTLINLLGCLDNPTSGELYLGGRMIFGNGHRGLSERDLTAIRRETYGYIFQNFYLIPTLTVEENIRLPLIFARKMDERRVTELIERVGLARARKALPRQLDGGDMQRVAIARALVNRPKFLLADEPTGRLEKNTCAAICRIFHELAADGLGVIIATHDPVLASEADRIVEFSDGRIAREETLKEKP